jgi:hypothetical protein
MLSRIGAKIFENRIGLLAVLGALLLGYGLRAWQESRRAPGPEFSPPLSDVGQFPPGFVPPGARPGGPPDPTFIKRIPFESERQKVLSTVRANPTYALAAVRELGVCATRPAGIELRYQLYCLKFAHELVQEFLGRDPLMQSELAHMNSLLRPEVRRAYEESQSK